MQIDWWTLALQAINFLVLIWLLWRFLYRPVKEVIEKRKQLAEQAFADAAGKGAEAEAAGKRLEEDRAALAQERQDMLKNMHDTLEAERLKAEDEAKRAAHALLNAARETIDEERGAVLTDLRAQAAELAAEIAASLLRKTGANASNDVFLEQIERELQSLSPDERKRLQKDLSSDGGRLAIVTATPLTPEERDTWCDRLGPWLDQKSKPDFATDPEILGGAELRFPRTVIKFTWADQLTKAKELLRSDETAS